MSYTTLQEIRIRLNEYSAEEIEGETVVSFPTNSKLDVKIELLISKAKKDIISYRHYPSHYKAEDIERDIEEKYHQVLLDLVLYDLSIEGADFQTQHSENAVNRSFTKRETILAKVLPFCKVFSIED